MIKLVLPDCIQRYLQCIDSKKILIGFSWWPDSMATYKLISFYYQSQWRDLSLIYLAYFNHRCRPESDDEERYIKEQYDQIITWVYDGCSKKEHKLRKARHDFFQQSLQKIHTTTLILGHNLNDRIETTLLNNKRWSWLIGHINMRMIDKKNGFTILRPLLDTTRWEILRYCSHIWASYLIDPTNTIESVSQRNAIRKTLWALSYHDIKSYRRQYLERENSYDLIHIPWKKIMLPEYSWFDALYEIVWTLSLDQLTKILKSIHCYEWVTKNNLNDLYSFIWSDHHGKKYRWSRIWYRTHGRVFLVHPNNCLDSWQMTRFRLQYNTTIIWIMEWTQWKRYNGKPMSKYCINNKVPLFLRHLIPLDKGYKPHDQLLLQVLSY